MTHDHVELCRPPSDRRLVLRDRAPAASAAPAPASAAPQDRHLIRPPRSRFTSGVSGGGRRGLWPGVETSPVGSSPSGGGLPRRRNAPCGCLSTWTPRTREAQLGCVGVHRGGPATMPRLRSQNVNAAQWSPNGGAHRAVGPDPARRQRLRRQRLLRRRPAPAAAQGRLPGAPGDARRGQGPRAGARRRRRVRDEGVGAGEGRHPLHALVPAADRHHRREARLLLRAHGRRLRDRRLLRQGAHPGRAGRVVVPDRRHPGDLRGPRLHRLGPDLAGLHPREPQRRAAVHPDGVRVVDGRGAGQQDPAAALDGRALALGRARAVAARRRRRPRRSSRPSGPSRSTS